MVRQACYLSQTKNIAIGVFEVHFARAPRIIRRRMAHARSFGEEFLVAGHRRRHSDPHPASRIALIAYTEEQMTVATRDEAKNCHHRSSIQLKPSTLT